MRTRLRLLARVAAHLVKSMQGIIAVYATCVSTGAVSLGSLLVFNSQPTATQMKMSLNEALEVAATTSPVIMPCMLHHICGMLGTDTCMLPGQGRFCSEGMAAQTCGEDC